MGCRVKVVKNDKLYLEEVVNLINNMGITGIVISPGPKRPEDAGRTVDIIRKFSGKLPLMGVCLGHQSIGYALGASIKRSDKLMHGKSSFIYFKDNYHIFSGISSPFEAMRYHSLEINKKDMPSELKVIAKTKEGEIMAVKHRQEPTYGFQFHPESILTSCGDQLIKNFLSICKKWKGSRANNWNR